MQQHMRLSACCLSVHSITAYRKMAWAHVSSSSASVPAAVELRTNALASLAGGRCSAVRAARAGVGVSES